MDEVVDGAVEATVDEAVEAVDETVGLAVDLAADEALDEALDDAMGNAATLNEAESEAASGLLDDVPTEEVMNVAFSARQWAAVTCGLVGFVVVRNKIGFSTLTMLLPVVAPIGLDLCVL